MEKPCSRVENTKRESNRLKGTAPREISPLPRGDGKSRFSALIKKSSRKRSDKESHARIVEETMGPSIEQGLRRLVVSTIEQRGSRKEREKLEKVSEGTSKSDVNCSRRKAPDARLSPQDPPILPVTFVSRALPSPRPSLSTALLLLYSFIFIHVTKTITRKHGQIYPRRIYSLIIIRATRINSSIK